MFGCRGRMAPASRLGTGTCFVRNVGIPSGGFGKPDIRCGMWNGDIRIGLLRIALVRIGVLRIAGVSIVAIRRAAGVGMGGVRSGRIVTGVGKNGFRHDGGGRGVDSVGVLLFEPEILLGSGRRVATVGLGEWDIVGPGATLPADSRRGIRWQLMFRWMQVAVSEVLGGQIVVRYPVPVSCGVVANVLVEIGRVASSAATGGATTAAPAERHQPQQHDQYQQRNAGQHVPPMPRELLGVRRRRRVTRLALTRHLQAGQQGRQVSRVGGERVFRAVPRDLAASELLRDHVDVHSLIADWRDQFAGRTAELVPRGLHSSTHDECTVVRGPEDHWLVGRRERDEPAGRRDTAVSLVAGGEPQVAADRTAQRLVLRQDVALDGTRAGGRAEIHLAASEVLDNSVTADGILPALLGPQRTAGATGRTPGHADGRGGVVWYLEAFQLVGKHRWVGGELLGFRVPGDLTAAELLSGDVAVVGFIPDRGTKNAA